MKKLYKKLNIPTCLFSILCTIAIAVSLMCSLNETIGIKEFSCIILIAAIAFFPFYVCFEKLYQYIEHKPIRNYSSSKICYYFVILFTLYTIMFISMYPGTISYDTQICILQFYHKPNVVSSHVNLLSQAQYITDHHKIAYVYLVGGCLELGRKLFHSYSAGYAFYMFIQYTFFSFAIAYMFSFISNRVGKIKWLFILNPIMLELPFNANKDVLFSCFFVIFSVNFIRFIYRKANYVIMILSAIGMCLFRGNAIYVLLITFVLSAILKRKKQLFALFCILLAFGCCYDHILLPTLDIAPSSKKEMLSVPFQATARYSLYYGEDVSNSEKEVINKVIDYDSLSSLYLPILSDPVKEKYNENCTTKELVNYFKTWIKMGLRHPSAYIESFIYNNYGYVCPWYDVNNLADKYDYSVTDEYFLKCITPPSLIEDAGLHIPFYPKKVTALHLIVLYEMVIDKIPVLSLIIKASGYIYILLFVVFYNIRNHNKQNYLFFVYCGLYFGTLLLGPKGGSLRYVYPFVSVTPLLYFLLTPNLSCCFCKSKRGAVRHERNKQNLQ